mmetsp:Transcript_4445/g.12862  ORF Transcript_4445/g.12862 Transcript_4445/m.12862 type:complete len:211 (-) Transcript_4445:623-1255(-)
MEVQLHSHHRRRVPRAQLDVVAPDLPAAPERGREGGPPRLVRAVRMPRLWHPGLGLQAATKKRRHVALDAQGVGHQLPAAGVRDRFVPLGPPVRGGLFGGSQGAVRRERTGLLRKGGAPRVSRGRPQGKNDPQRAPGVRGSQPAVEVPRADPAADTGRQDQGEILRANRSQRGGVQDRQVHRKHRRRRPTPSLRAGRQRHRHHHDPGRLL